MLIYLGLLRDFLNGCQDSVFKFKDIVKKPSDVIFDVTVVESAQSLKILIIFFFLCSICSADKFSNTPRPSL